MLENSFNFIMLLVSFDIMWQPGIVRSVSFGFDVWFQEGSVKGVVNAPGVREFEFVHEQA